VRAENISNLYGALMVYQATHGSYPVPDNKVNIIYSGTTIGFQGYIKSDIARLINFSPEGTQDPLNADSFFSYSTNKNQDRLQILGFMEKDSRTSLSPVAVASAAETASPSRIPYTKGDELGMFYLSGTLTPLQDSGTGIIISTSTNEYQGHFNTNDNLAGTGKILQNLLLSYTYGKGFGSPDALDCPTGFVPVPGNKALNLPGFCVAKYEMKVAGGAVHAASNTHYYLTGDIISSNATDVPVSKLTQQQAIDACKSMGVGYHLITDAEWITIARNIEATSSNWSGNAVGSGALYSGHNDAVPAYALAASTDDTF